MLQCVVVCAVCCSVLNFFVKELHLCLMRYGTCASLLQYVIVCCSVLQCVVVCCSVLSFLVSCYSMLLSHGSLTRVHQAIRM